MSFKYFRFNAGTESVYELVRTSCNSALGIISPDTSILAAADALHDSVNRILLALDTSTTIYQAAIPLLAQAISIGACEAVTSTEYFEDTAPVPASSGGPATTDASLLTSGTLSDARLSGNVVLSSSLATVATSGAYSDLTGKPTIPAAVTTLPYSSITGTPTLAAVATSGSYVDLTNKPTIPSAYSLPTATASVLGGIKIGSGLSIDGSGVVTAAGGGSGNIVGAATASAFPATGAANTLYLATEVSRVYRYESGVYVEVGTAGGGGSDAVLRALFAPSAPTSVSATGGNAQVAVTWTAPSVSAQTPITDYTVQRSTDGTTWTTFSRASSTATSVTVTGLTNGTAYTFRVAAVNGIGSGAYSTPSSAVTPANVPAGITVLSGSASGGGTNTITATANGTISISVPSARTVTYTGNPGQYIAGPYQPGFSFDSEYGVWYKNFIGSFGIIAGTYTIDYASSGATFTFTP